jgi:hypothetical protein
VYEILKNARRRAVLQYLLYEERTADFRELVEYVAALENGSDPGEVTSAERNRVRTALYQHHLDKLAELGYIEYDKREGTIRATPATDSVEGYIDPEATGTPSIGEYSFGLLTLAVAAVLAWMPTLTGFTALAVGGIGLLLIVHVYEQRSSS